MSKLQRSEYADHLVDKINTTYLKELLSKDPNFKICNIFNPMISKLITYSNKRAFIAPVDKVRNRFKIDSDNTIFEIMDEFYKLGMTPILAGGKLISWINGDIDSQNDFDLFFLNVNCYFQFQEICVANPQDWKHIADVGYLSEWIYKEKYKIQLINKPFSNIEDIIENFDLKCCCIAYYNGNIVWLKGAIKEIKRKILSINNLSVKATGTIRRIYKYAEKGYSIQAADIICISALLLDNVIEDIEQKSQEYLAQYFSRDYKHERNVLDYETWLNSPAEINI